MTTDFRALCADLLNNLEHSAYQHCLQGEIDNDPLITRARAALAAPTPEGAPVVTDKQILAMCSWSSIGHAFDSDLVEFGRACYDLGRQHGAAHPTPPAPAGGLVERVAELREKFEQLIKCSRAYDGYSTMTPVELADRLIDAVLKLEADR
jgi:hypothetical protein